jgi:hypothetical protein
MIDILVNNINHDIYSFVVKIINKKNINKKDKKTMAEGKILH